MYLGEFYWIILSGKCFLMFHWWGKLLRFVCRFCLLLCEHLYEKIQLLKSIYTKQRKQKKHFYRWDHQTPWHRRPRFGWNPVIHPLGSGLQSRKCLQMQRGNKSQTWLKYLKYWEENSALPAPDTQKVLLWLPFCCLPLAGGVWLLRAQLQMRFEVLEATAG